MKPNLSRNNYARGAFAPLACVLLLLTGCLEKIVVWSPDGRRAAVIIKDGLRLCDADGRLSPVLLPGVYRAAWLADSQQLVVARKSTVDTWTPVARALGPDAASALVAKAEAFWQKIQSGTSWSLAGSLFGDREFNAMCLYLRERYGEAVRAKLDGVEWKKVTERHADIHDLVMARIDGDRVVPGTQLHEGLGAVMEIRLAPGDRAVAFTAEMKWGKDDQLQLLVARVNATGATPVTDRVATFPDWTADGGSLVYVQAAGGDGKDELRLGTLVRREVLDTAGNIAVKEEVKYLAGWIFSGHSRVRCLRDGRILFNAAEISLPIAAEDYGEQREQLFALDPARQATLVRVIPRKQEEHLPQTLAFFAVSPDEKQVLFGSFDGTVALLTMATGEVHRVQEGSKDDGLQGQPVWRTAGEFSYTRRARPKDGEKPARDAEVVLWSGGKDGRILSRDWPDEVVNALISRK